MTTIANMLPTGDAKRIFANWVRVEATKKSDLRGAGLFSISNELNARAAGEGNIGSIRHFNPLTGASVVGSDDLSQKIAPGALSGGELVVARQFRNKAWAAASLTSTVIGQDVMGYAASAVGAWRALDEQDVVMSMLAGVRADAVQNSDAAMLYGDGTEILNATTLARAAQKKGAWKKSLSVLIVHSEVHTKMQIDNQILVVPASDQNPAFETYQGKRLVVSDAMPVVDEAEGIYTSLLCAPGIIAYGEASPKNAEIEVGYDPAAGNGSGGETLYTRRQFIMGVNGYSLTAANVDNAGLAAHANYARVYDAKQIPLVFVTTNIGN